MRRFNAIGWTALVAVLAVVAVGVTFAVRAATAGPSLSEVAETCGGRVGSDGESIEMNAYDTAVIGTLASDGDERQTLRDLGIGTFGDVVCLLGMLDAPSSVEPRMENTRALDGAQEASWGGYSATWTYHPDDGLGLVVSKEG